MTLCNGVSEAEDYDPALSHNGNKKRLMAGAKAMDSWPSYHPTSAQMRCLAFTLFCIRVPILTLQPMVSNYICTLIYLLLQIAQGLHATTLRHNPCSWVILCFCQHCSLSNSKWELHLCPSFFFSVQRTSPNTSMLGLLPSYTIVLGVMH